MLFCAIQYTLVELRGLVIRKVGTSGNQISIVYYTRRRCDQHANLSWSLSKKQAIQVEVHLTQGAKALCNVYATEFDIYFSLHYLVSSRYMHRQ